MDEDEYIEDEFGGTWDWEYNEDSLKATHEAHQAGLDEDEAVERAQDAFIRRCEPED